jgi:hypothetical protein
VLDQVNGALGASGTAILKGFNPTNPHLGDAIVATFFWLGSTNIITAVTDHLTDQTPVGNTYTLVDYVTSGGVSMATYVATNVQNFPDPNLTPEKVLVVQADLASPITDGGVTLSAYRGVTVQLGAHASASGSGAAPTTADPGAIAVGTGALAYGVTMSDAITAGLATPTTFTNISTQSDGSMKTDGEYVVQATAGSVDPQWTWFFNGPSTWLATVLALNPAPTHLVFSVQPSTTLPLFTIQPAVRVTVVDDLGNPAPSYTGAVTIAIGHNGGMVMPGTLSGTKTVAVVNGVATFSDLSIDQAGNGYTLQATASGLTGSASAAFNIGAF